MVHSHCYNVNSYQGFYNCLHALLLFYNCLQHLHNFKSHLKVKTTVSVDYKFNKSFLSQIPQANLSVYCPILQKKKKPFKLC